MVKCPEELEEYMHQERDSWIPYTYKGVQAPILASAYLRSAKMKYSQQTHSVFEVGV